MPGDSRYELDPDTPYFLCDTFGGLEYEIDVSRSAGQRIRALRFHGQELREDAQLTLAVNNYRYASILKGKNLISAQKEWTSSCTIRELLIDYVKANSPLTPVCQNGWKVVGAV